MRCSRERLNWLDDKFQGWLDSNGPLCPCAARSTRSLRGKSVLLMLAGATACLAQFISINPKQERVAQPALEARSAPELAATEDAVALKR